jgi:hypothetical protein
MDEILLIKLLIIDQMVTLVLELLLGKLQMKMEISHVSRKLFQIMTIIQTHLIIIIMKIVMIFLIFSAITEII